MTQIMDRLQQHLRKTISLAFLGAHSSPIKTNFALAMRFHLIEQQ